MLELKQQQEDAVRECCAASALTYSAGCEAYAATDGQGGAGYCVFTLEGGTLTLLAVQLRPDYGAELADGLVRAVLAYALHQGICSARFAPGFDSGLRDKLRAFGHIDETVSDIDKFLTSCKNCRR